MFSKHGAVVLVGLWAATAMPAAAADADIDRDLLHTVAARRALLQDRDLGSLNLAVKVHNRVATLWGPVPSQELARRAVEVLRKLPELIEVRSELQVERRPDRPLFLPEVPPERWQPPPLPPPPVPPGILAKRPVGGMLALPGGMLSRPEPVGLGALNSRRESMAPMNPLAWQQVQSSRKDPRMPDDRVIDVVMSALPVPPPPEPAVKPLPQAIQDLQKDRRFSQIRIEITDEIVYLTATGEQSQAVYDLAQIISRLNGVQRVVVREGR